MDDYNLSESLTGRVLKIPTKSIQISLIKTSEIIYDTNKIVWYFEHQICDKHFSGFFFNYR